MAIASGGTLGTGTSSTSGTSFTLTTATNTLAAGNAALLTVVTDNTGTGDSNYNEHTGVSGGAGTWTKLGEYTNGQGAAAGGVTVSLWLFEATGSVPTGTVFTITLATARVDKVASCWKFTKAANTNLVLDSEPGSNPITNVTDGAQGFGSVAFSGLASASRLYFRALGKEANSTTALTVSSGFTTITAQRSRNNASAVLVRGEFRINTSTGETSNPTLAISGDTAGLFVALREQAVAALDGAATGSASASGDLTVEVTPAPVRTRYVNPDSSGGNGTTAALSGANAAYASLNLCLVLEAADLVAADVYLEVFCATNGSADGAVYVDSADGWVCDATRNIRIRAADGHRAGTKWNTSKYRIEAGLTWLTCITSTVPYTHIDGLQVWSNADDDSLRCFAFSAVGCVVSNCLGRLPEGTFTYGNYCGYIVGPVNEDGAGDAPTVVYNSVFYGGPSNRDIVGIRADNSWLEVYNCTLSGNGYTGSIGIRDSYGHVTAKNNLVVDFETPFYGGFDETDYNATDTTSSYVGSNGRQSQTFSFVAADDFALTGSDAGARDYGVTDPSSGMFTDDMLGTTRTGAWDIGAHEYTAASTLLAGHDGTGWSTTDEGMQAGSTQEIYQPVDGLATGTATAVKLYVSSWDGATELSVALYTAAGVLVAESDVIASAGGTGLRTAAIDAAVTANTDYLLVVFADGYWGQRRKSDGTGYTTYSQAIGEIGSAPASFTPGGGSNSAATEFICYLEGAGSGGGSQALEGAATASATAAGSVSVTKPLAGDATGAATAGGAATVGKPLSGAADGSASAQGGISVTKPLAGAASGSAIAQAGASVAKPVAGSAASSATAQADLTVTSGAVSHELGGDAAGAGSASASLSVTKPLAGAAAGTAGAQGGLAVAKPLAGDAQGQASAAGDLTLVGHVDLAGDAATAAQAAADLTVTPAVALEAPRGGDDAPGHGHRGWDRRRATLRRKREHEFTEQIRDLYRALTSDPATAERAEAIVGAVVPPAPVRGETEAAHEAAQLVRAEALRQRADALDAEAVQAEIALRLLYREYRERQEREDLDALGVLLPALLGVAPEPFAAGREALAGELWSDDYDMDALQVLLAEVL